MKMRNGMIEVEVASIVDRKGKPASRTEVACLFLNSLPSYKRRGMEGEDARRQRYEENRPESHL